MNFARYFDFSGHIIYGNPLGLWTIACLAALVILAALLAARNFFYRYHASLPTDRWGINELFMELFSNARLFFLLATSLYTATLFLYLPLRDRQLCNVIAIMATLVQVALWGNSIIAFFINRHIRRTDPNGNVRLTIGALGMAARLAIWSVTTLWILQNLGINVTTLVASLGIGGIAVGLAAQSVLGDLFASLAIVLDRPFALGDFIGIDDKLIGSVEHIGIKSTRIRSLSGEQIVFANSKLLQQQISNYKRLYERRVEFCLAIDKKTPRECLSRIPKAIREIVQSQQKVRFDRAHLTELSGAALKFESVYYVLSPDFKYFLDVQQTIYLKLLDQLHEWQIQLA